MGIRRTSAHAVEDEWSLAACARDRGFTILELMLVIAILAVLTTVAIAVYQDYTKRTRMLELMMAAGSCRNLVFEAFYYGSSPQPGQWGCESAGPWSRYVQSIAVGEDGLISVTARGFADEDIDGKVLTLAPMVDGVPAAMPEDKGKTIRWRCGAVVDGTTIPANVLPSSCVGS